MVLVRPTSGKQTLAASFDAMPSRSSCGASARRTNPRWFDDRVAAANLAYPLKAKGRAYLHFWRYTDNGQTAFVWYRKLSDQPLHEEDNS
jgi:hypothetical protein